MADQAPSEDPCTGNRQFHGVYLLYCMNPQYKGRTYIGYTVNPQRRIMQHNLGKRRGGAWKTSGRGPWDMVLIVHGFPNDVAGLRFEWAWQHPTSSRRLKHVKRKMKNEKGFDVKLRILAEMLRTGPWNRLPLTIQWLKQEYARPFPANLQPPMHVPIAYGPIKVKKKCKNAPKVPSDNGDNDFDGGIARTKQCYFCFGVSETDNAFVNCCKSNCSFVAHCTCFADDNNDSCHLIPVTVKCPKCQVEMLWGDLVYGKKQEQDEGIQFEEDLSQGEQDSGSEEF